MEPIILNRVNTFIPDCMSIVQPGIYSFKNDIDKKIYIGHSNNILNAIQKHITQIKYNIHPIRNLQTDFNKCEFKIIETIENKTERLIKLKYHCDEYSKQKYKLYNKYKGLQYTVQVSIEFLKLQDVAKHYMTVKLVNRNHDKIIVGIFNNMDEVKEFLNKSYNHTNYPVPIYAENDLTKYFLTL